MNATTSIRLLDRGGAHVANAEIPSAVPEAVRWRDRVFLHVGWDGSVAVYREVLAHLLVDEGDPT